MSWIEAATGLTPIAFAAAAALTFMAALIRGFTGFGMAIVLVPLLAIFIRPDAAVVLAILLQLLIGPVGLRAIFQSSDRTSALTIAAAAVVATPLGALALNRTPPDIARLALAAIAIGAFLLVLLPNRKAGRPGTPLTVATGLAAGVLTGFAAMPGPPVVPYYLRGGFAPQVARASMMLIFFATAIAGTVSSFALGLATQRLALLSALLFLPMVAGNHLGGKMFGKVPETLWRAMVALLLGAAGLSALVRLLNG